MTDQTKPSRVEEAAATYGEIKYIREDLFKELERKHSLAQSDLEQALEVIEFYGANESWVCSGDPQFGDSITAEDYEEGSPITKRRFVGGKKAREFLQRMGRK